MATTASTRALGMGTAELVEPDWPVLTEAELCRVLARYPQLDGFRQVLWHSPRPLSAAALVEVGDPDLRQVFVKRHHHRVRDVYGLREEHSFQMYLRQRGITVAHVLSAQDGNTAVTDGEWTYEVHTGLSGDDLYRVRFSWTPYLSLVHAQIAGATLATLHNAAEGFAAPARPPRPLLVSHEIFSSAHPVNALRAFADARPALADFLGDLDWRDDLTPLLSLHERSYPALAGLTPLWTHNDWHPSNLLWASETEGQTGQLAVLDFGLANRTTAVHDLATAIERSAVQWIGARMVHFDQVDALLAGYLSVRPLSAAERAALPVVLPLVHADYALSEVQYFHGVLGRPEQAMRSYVDYFLGHATWFAEDGVPLTDHLRKRLG